MQGNDNLATFAARVSAFIASSVPCFSGGIRPSDSLDDEFNGLALELFALQFEFNLPYRCVCQARHVTPDAVEHWSQIPAVPTAAFKEQEFSSLAPAQRTAVFYSSGTTRQRPSRHFHNNQSLALYEASLWPWFTANVLRCSTPDSTIRRMLALTPAPVAAPHSSLVHMFGAIQRGLGSPAPGFIGRAVTENGWELDLEQADRALRMALKSAEPLLVVGTAFSFVHLLDYMVARGLQFALPAGSRVMETGGYKGRSRVLPKADLHALLTDRLGIRPEDIVCEYGMSELSSQAYARNIASGPPANTSVLSLPFFFPPWARAQVISPETGREVEEGETGLLRVFDLANVWSVLAIQTEDVATRRDAGFELIGRAALTEPRGCSLMAAY